MRLALALGPQLGTLNKALMYPEPQYILGKARARTVQEECANWNLVSESKEELAHREVRHEGRTLRHAGGA